MSVAATISAEESVRRTVLLIEDDRELREAMADALSARGFTVLAAGDGRDGLRMMRERRPDVVVLDLMMPGMDGWQFRIEQRLEPGIADTPVVALSASHAPAAAAIDADLFLQKPCTAEVIVDAIDEVIAMRKRREEPARLALSDRMAALGTLAAGVVHEINNPLTYVLLHLTSALRGLGALRTPANGDKIDGLIASLTAAQQGTERIRNITRGIRSFSRVDVESHATLDVREPLEAAIGLIANDLRHRARLVRVDEPTPFVHANEGGLAQVFLNLLSNAVQALPEAAADVHQIRVRNYTDEHGRAVVEVADTGPGIPAHALPHIFEPFYTTKPLGEGTGLGLSISHGIVRGLGGDIEVTSAPGQGAAFRVVLPPASSGERP